MFEAKKDIADFLKTAFEARITRNPRYSLRSFARDLNVSPPWLTRLLNRERGMSLQSARAISKKLGLSEQEQKYFIELAGALFGRSKKARETSQRKISKLGSQYNALDVEAFKVISEWYHLALLSYLDTVKGAFAVKTASKRLGISVLQIEQALERLLNLEMIEKVGETYRSTGVFFANPAGIPSQSVRSFHKQVLEKAIDALEMKSTKERDSSALVVAVDKTKLPEMRDFIKEFRDEFEARFCKTEKSKNEVCALTIQLFQLTSNGQKNDKEKNSEKNK